MVHELLIDFVALIVGLVGILYTLFSSLKVKGKFRTANSLLLLGYIFGYLVIVAFTLEDFNLLNGNMAHIVQKTLIALAAIFLAISSKINYGLYRNIPSVLLEKLRR